MHETGKVHSLRELTTPIYSTLNPMERALAERYYLRYTRLLHLGRPVQYGNTPIGIAQLAFTYAIRGPILPDALLGGLGLILLASSGARLAIRLAGAVLLVLFAAYLAVTLRKVTGINEYFRAKRR